MARVVALPVPRAAMGHGGVFAVPVASDAVRDAIVHAVEVNSLLPVERFPELPCITASDAVTLQRAGRGNTRIPFSKEALASMAAPLTIFARHQVGIGGWRSTEPGASKDRVLWFSESVDEEVCPCLKLSRALNA